MEDNRTWFGKMVLPAPTQPVDYAYDGNTGLKVPTVAKPVNFSYASDFEAQNNETGVDASGNRVRQKKGGGLPVEMEKNPGWFNGQHQVTPVNPRSRVPDMSTLPQASYSNEGRGATQAGGPLPVSMPDANAAPQAPTPAPAAKAGGDPWKDMAAQLSQYSQQRAGVSAPPQQQMGGFNSLPDYAAAENEEKTRRWARDGIANMSGISQRERARLMTQMTMNDANNQTAREGQGVTARGQDLSAGVTSRGQDMSAMSVAQGHGVQSRGQDMQAMSTMFGHQATGLNQEAHDKRAREAGMDLETLKQADPKNKGLMEYYKQHGLESEAKANLYGIQGRAAQQQLDFDKSSDASIQKWFKAHSDAGLTPDEAMKQALKAHLAGRRATKSEGDNGYAEGGSVFADDSQAGLDKRLAAMQAMNTGASVTQAYGGMPKFGEWNFDTNTDPTLRSHGDYNSFSRSRFAQGGPIAVGGRPVLGAGDGKSDSLPAVIDGEHPAALSTGEFVMPIEAVQHFGLDRLNKMVAAARKGLDTGRGQSKMQQPANA